MGLSLLYGEYVTARRHLSIVCRIFADFKIFVPSTSERRLSSPRSGALKARCAGRHPVWGSHLPDSLAEGSPSSRVSRGTASLRGERVLLGKEALGLPQEVTTQSSVASATGRQARHG